MSGFVEDVRAAETALRVLFEPTPLQRNDYLSAKYGAGVWLKREDLSPVRSYKLRGAFNAMRKALAARPERRRGNFDFERLPDVKERALRWEGRKKYYILRLPQRPGAQRDFLSVLGPDDDIARFEYLKRSARNFGSVLLGIETRTPGDFEGLETRMTRSGFTWLDITDDPVLTSLII